MPFDRRTWAALGAVAWCAALTWWAYGRGARVPLLAFVDLGFHELGHLVFYIFPISDLITAAAGSAFEIGVPVGIALYFLVWRHDRVAASVCLAWAATSARSVAIYVADAPFKRLPLIGGEHDWAYILGPQQLARLDRAEHYAMLTKGFGLVLAIVAAGLAVDALVTRAPARKRSALSIAPLHERVAAPFAGMDPPSIYGTPPRPDGAGPAPAPDAVAREPD